MDTFRFKYIYGPVPSRRLGRSLGLDIVPFKICDYDCIYCQLGRTTKKTIERKDYVVVEDVINELVRTLAAGVAPDYISISGSGEPTLNSGIGELIRKVKRLTEIPVAVLTNGSLLWMSEVQDALMEADLVLPSLDAGDMKLFRHVNRPHPSIKFEQMVDGIAEFTRRFKGEVRLEVLLLDGVTGIPSEVEKIAAFAKYIRPDRIQLNTVFRPPTEEFAYALTKDQMKRLGNLFTGKVEIISDDEAGRSSGSEAGSATNEIILSLLSRRPCTVQGISAGLGLSSVDVLKRLDELSKQGMIIPIRRNRALFYETVKP